MFRFTVPSARAYGASPTAAAGGEDAYEQINDSPDVPSTNSYLQNNPATDASAFLLLSDMPGSFVTASGVTFVAHVTGTGFTDDTCNLYAQVFQSDETSALTDEMLIATEVTDGKVSVPATGVIAGNKTQWDGARLRLRWDHTVVSATDTSAHIRVNEARALINYTT